EPEPEPVVEPDPVVEPEPEPEPVVEPDPAIVLTPPPGVEARPEPEPAIVLTPPPGVAPRAEPEPPAADLAAAQPIEPEVAALADPTAEMLASFRIQLGSFRNEDAAMTHWAAVVDRNRAVLDGLSPLVRAADLGDRGTFYRLQAGPLASSIVAVALCDVLKTNNVDCLVISP
ncbi:MAG: SPOR domain-containing protein, partial [Alphaproteobacteria bacterium]|nr:SPOR domain-containing protein [Alphaproteobacteria bacterium]